jgi:hypothetical protein
MPGLWGCCLSLRSGETPERPVDLFAEELEHLRPLNPHLYDIVHMGSSRHQGE